MQSIPSSRGPDINKTRLQKELCWRFDFHKDLRINSQWSCRPGFRRTAHTRNVQASTTLMDRRSQWREGRCTAPRRGVAFRIAGEPQARVVCRWFWLFQWLPRSPRCHAGRWGRKGTESIFNGLCCRDCTERHAEGGPGVEASGNTEKGKQASSEGGKKAASVPPFTSQTWVPRFSISAMRRERNAARKS